MNIKLVTAFAVGVLVGSAVAYKTVESKFTAQLKAQDEKSKEFWKKYYSENHEDPKEEVKTDEDPAKEYKSQNTLDIIPETTKASEVWAPVDTTATDYHAAFGIKVDPLEDHPREEDIIEEPYPITEEMFDEYAAQGWNDIYMHYWEEDGTYTDSNDDELTEDEAHWPDLLGKVPMTDAADGKVYYVANEKFRTILKVENIQNSYGAYLKG